MNWLENEPIQPPSHYLKELCGSIVETIVLNGYSSINF